MKISLDWIQDFTKIPVSDPQKIAERLTLGCAEVEDVLTEGLFWEQTLVAEIVSIEAHPEADKLNLVSFDYGGKELKKVVCGASNVRKGLKTPYAPTGTLLPNGLLLEPKKIRGFLSEGMLCSEEELCLAQSSEGIMELDPEAKVGTSLKELFQKKVDTILDIDNKSLTHRPDLWGHFGLAREFSALFESPLKNPYDSSWKEALAKKINTNDSPIKVKLDKDCAGLAYFGLSLSGVKVETSPEWMQQRLRSVGLRPINNIVDISNYVMLELGMPLHIFDRQKITGDTVHIKALNQAQSFETLDEIQRDLIPGDTVICDAQGPLVLAGIMGGLKSGVSESTTEIFIEVANWKAAPIRRTSTRLGLRTDSSQRYEKTLDSKLCERTLFRTLELVLQLCPESRVEGKIEYDGIALDSIETLEIDLNKKRLAMVLGEQIEDQKIQSIFERLAFEVSNQTESFKIKVPSFRATKDIECEADLIEEVGRVIGYDNIRPSSPALDIRPVSLSAKQKLERQTREFMVYHAHAFEVMTYPMIGKKLLSKCGDAFSPGPKIVNSLSQDHEFMRPSLIPSLLEASALNAKQRDRFHFFELGRVYQNSAKKFCEESSHLALVMYHPSQSIYKELLNTTQRYLEALNLPADLCSQHPKFKNELVDESWSGVHPYEFQNIRLMGKMKGVAFSFHPLMLRDFKIKGHLSAMILDLSLIQEKAPKDKTRYHPLAKFPGSDFDCTVVTSAEEEVANVLAALKSFKLKEFKGVKVADVFKLDEQRKTVTLRAHFHDDHKTLNGDFLTKAKDEMVSLLDRAGYPLKS